MKKTFLIGYVILTTFKSYSQEIINGWYYLPEPAGNIFGVGYHEPKRGSALSYAGNTKDLDESNFIIQPGPQTIQRVINQIKSMAFTSLFKSNKAIDYNINVVQLKQIILKSNVYKDFDDGNFYVTQALKADSVIILGRINRSLEADSKDAETIISAFAAQPTVAFKLVNTLTNINEEKKTGILSYSQINKDSFKIVITDPEVFFAVKLTKVKNIGNPESKIDKGKENDIIQVNSDNPADIIYWRYPVNRSLYVGIRFRIQNDTAIAEVYEQYGGKNLKVLSKVERLINNEIIQFVVEGYTVSPNMSRGRRKSIDYLITAIGSFSFNPVNKTIIVNPKIDNKFQTAVYHIEGNYITWPK